MNGQQEFKCKWSLCQTFPNRTDKKTNKHRKQLKGQ